MRVPSVRCPVTPSDAMPEVPETVATYLRLRGLESSPRKYRKRARRRDGDDSQPFAKGRDPRPLGDVVSQLTQDSGWDVHLAQEDVVLAWAEIAGAETAARTRPVAFREGTLTIQADSTAWAKQLTLLRAQILTEIMRRYPDAGVQTLRFIGPDVPSWKWGLRAIPGRGPRDTYG